MANVVSHAPRRRHLVLSLFAILGCSVTFLGGCAEVLNYLDVKPPRFQVIVDTVKNWTNLGNWSRSTTRSRPIHLILIAENFGLSSNVEVIDPFGRALAARLNPSDQLSIWTFLAGQPLLVRKKENGTVAAEVAKNFFRGLYNDPGTRPELAVEKAVDMVFKQRSDVADTWTSVVVSLSADKNGCRVVLWSSPTQFTVLDADGDKAIDRIVAGLRPDSTSGDAKHVVLDTVNHSPSVATD